MSFFIAIKNTKNGRYELYSTIRDGIPLGDFKSCEYSTKSTALMDCKYLIDMYGKDNVKLFEEISLDINTTVKIMEKWYETCMWK